MSSKTTIVPSELQNVVLVPQNITKCLDLVDISQIILPFLGGSNSHFWNNKRLLKKVSGQYHYSKFTFVFSVLCLHISTVLQKLSANSLCINFSLQKYIHTRVNKTITLKWS